MRTIQTKPAQSAESVAAIESAVAEGVIDYIVRRGARNPYDPHELATDHAAWQRGQQYAHDLLPFIVGRRRLARAA